MQVGSLFGEGGLELMALLFRPLRQWPCPVLQLQNRCYAISLHYLLSSPILLEPTKSKSHYHFSLAPLASSSNRNHYFPSRGLRLANDPELQVESNSDDSSPVAKKSRNQLKHEARRAVLWGMELASFSAPQIKRILRFLFQNVNYKTFALPFM